MLKHRIALLSICSVVLAAAVLARGPQVADTVVNPLASSQAAAAAGQQTFVGTCQSCHNVGGTGDADRGVPALNTTNLKQGDGDADLFRTIKSGIPGTGMPAYGALSDQQIWQLVSYIRSLQAARAAGPARTAPAANAAAVPGNAAAGEAVFFGAKAACATCHEVNGRGGVVGPDLSNAARLDVAALRQKIVSPNTPLPAAGGGGGFGGRGGRGFGGGGAAVTVIAKTTAGATIRGIRRNEDTFSLQMIDATGKLQLLDKRQLASVSVDPKSLMPEDYGQRLTADEITNVVAFLKAQTGRDEAKIMQAPMASGGLTYERMVNSKAEPQNWPMYWGGYNGMHYSPLTQITAANVSRLRPAWTFPLVTVNADGRPGGVLEGTPLVVDGVMYATGSGNPSTVVALDARTGRELWRWSRQQKTVNPYQINPYSRGVAMLNNRIYVGTLDAALIALDARSGRQLWEVPVADTMEGITITSPPLIVKDKVLVGSSGGEYATRGRLDAFDAASGKHLWRFYTTAGDDDPNSQTWKGDSWKTGGAPTWLTGSYDPELNTVYWATGNPSSQIDRSVRGDGDNLYSDCVIALDPDTGKLKWYYQFTPNDGHDWDSVQALVLVDRVWHGQNQKLLLHADRNSHFYVLDRTNGKFLSGTPYVYQNWNTGFDEKGRPKPLPNSNSSPEGSYLIYPSLGGGTNWQSPSYSPATGWFYLSYQESGQQFASAPATAQRGQQNTGRGRGSNPATRQPADPEPNSGIKAIDVETGKTTWQFPTFQGSLSNGVLATGGNVVFGSVRDGNLLALDAKTGKYLWHYQTGGSHAAAPMSYSINGTQYIGFSAGNVIFAFSLAQ
jgi:alcohol dehydrogenase (cytochrome c)